MLPSVYSLQCHYVLKATANTVSFLFIFIQIICVGVQTFSNVCTTILLLLKEMREVKKTHIKTDLFEFELQLIVSITK